MKKIAKLLFLLLITTSIAFVGCNRDDDGSTPTPSFEVLKTYVTTNDLDIDDLIDDYWIITADGVNAKGADEYHIIDLRDPSDFAAGHIANAVNKSLTEVLTEAANATKPILVVCYTGQTAGHAVMALRLSGFFDAKVLKWGMAGWNSNFTTKWVSNIDSTAQGSASWIPAPGQIASNQSFSDPSFTSTFTDGALILEERIDYMLNKGFQGVSNVDVLGTPTNYFINNFWDLTNVQEYGNITGAYRIKPLTFEGGEYLHMDASKTVVTYCWTGQTSSMVTAYLTVMGYEAKSLMFGANGMIYNLLHTHKYTVPTTDYPVVP